jgi:hypothetical protein
MTDPLRELLRESVDAWADKDAEWWADWHERVKAALALAETAGQIKAPDGIVAVDDLTKHQANQIKAQALREAADAISKEFTNSQAHWCPRTLRRMASDHEQSAPGGK